MIKTKKGIKAVAKGKDKTSSKVSLPVASYSRLQVCLSLLKNKTLKLGRAYDLSKVKAFCEGISSRPGIGSTTRKGLKKAGYAVEMIKTLSNKNIWSVVKFVKA
jgi:aspartokinase